VPSFVSGAPKVPQTVFFTPCDFLAFEVFVSIFPEILWKKRIEVLRVTPNSEPVFVNVYGAQGIDSEESISPAYVVWRAGTKNRVVVPACQAGNRYLCLKL
jgi:hypothetical protein